MCRERRDDGRAGGDTIALVVWRVHAKRGACTALMRALIVSSRIPKGALFLFGRISFAEGFAAFDQGFSLRGPGIQLYGDGVLPFARRAVPGTNLSLSLGSMSGYRIETYWADCTGLCPSLVSDEDGLGFAAPAAPLLRPL